MNVARNGIESGLQAFRSAVSSVIEHGASVWGMSDGVERQVATRSTMAEPLERLLGHHGADDIGHALGQLQNALLQA
ncbi:MAG: hypothetical protein H7123_05545 [Thermoleophilia bacterium]|nr:hypothetical protein [Thermoleophilia bacterium]